MITYVIYVIVTGSLTCHALRGSGTGVSDIFRAHLLRAVSYQNSFLTFLVDGVAAGKRLCYSTRVYPTRFNK